MYGSKKRAMQEIAKRQEINGAIAGSQKNYENWGNPS